MEQAVEQKLADARKQSEKKEEDKSDKKSIQKPSSPRPKNNTKDKSDEKIKDTKADKSSKGADKKFDPSSSKKQDPKDAVRKPDSNSKKQDSKDADKKSDSNSKKQDSKGSSDKKYGNSGEAKDREKNDIKPGTKEFDKKNGKDSYSKTTSKESASKSRTSRDKSWSPMLFERNYYYKDTFETRSDSKGGRSPAKRRTRSPPRRRSRSPPRRRSRSPIRHRRSPSSLRGRDSWRRSPKRRSRSPHDRIRRSSERRDPKALMAKKSFLDDLAVKFAQEGKEFPELEQYRCEINSQFVSNSHSNQFSRKAVEHLCSNISAQNAFMEMTMMAPQMNLPMSNPIVLTDPYNAYPVYQDPSLLSYPIQEPQPMLDSPSMPLECPQLSSMSQPLHMENTSVLKSATYTQNTGTKPSKPSQIWTKQEVKIRIKQALQLLDDADRSVTKSGKFMFRAPTFYENNVNENRSPIVQSDCNPIFGYNTRSGASSSDPFGNVPPKLKAVIDVLRMDEGLISERIYQRHNKNHKAASVEKAKLKAEDRIRFLSNTPMSKKSLQKTTQTDPTACTDCLLRKIKVRYNEGTQTDIVRTIDSCAQTKPMQMQTVSEFGSITELTPNQVRAVSELIKYIKLTVTSGNLKEMRDSLKEDQVYNLNSDLRMAYHYFDAMVENQDLGGPHKVHESESLDRPEDYNEPHVMIEDETVDEYEEYHRAFCPDPDEEGEEAEDYFNPLLLQQNQPSSFQRPLDNRNRFGNNTAKKKSFENSGGNFGGPSRGQFNQQRGRGGARGSKRGAYLDHFNRRK